MDFHSGKIANMHLFLVLLLLAVLLVLWPVLQTFALIFLGVLAGLLGALLLTVSWLAHKIWRFFFPR